MFWFRKQYVQDARKLGQWGERFAERMLRRRGWKTVERRFLCRNGELDLIMKTPDRILVFIEVKTRVSEAFVDVEKVITPAKQKRMVRACRYFLAGHDYREVPLRFDLVAIVLGPRGRPAYRHYERIFVP